MADAGDVKTAISQTLLRHALSVEVVSARLTLINIDNIF